MLSSIIKSLTRNVVVPHDLTVTIAEGFLKIVDATDGVVEKIGFELAYNNLTRMIRQYANILIDNEKGK